MENEYLTKGYYLCYNKIKTNHIGGQRNGRQEHG